MNKVTPIILTGGIGSRLWPLSTKDLPKQFLNLPFNAKHNLFQQTLLGVKNKKIFKKPIIVCSEKHKFLALNSLNNINFSYYDIIVEKISKNTAISVLLGVIHAINNIDSKYSLILPSDHYIQKRDYTSIIPKDFNQNRHLIFGIKPKFPSIDYGYISVEKSSNKIKEVKKFLEKPNIQNAKAFIKKGYFWNSGIFLLNNQKLLLDYKKYFPRILKQCEKISSSLKKDLEFKEADLKLMADLPNISFDKAILENNDFLSMMNFNKSWKDIGSWNSLTEISKKNIKLHPQTKIFNNSENSSIISDRKNTVLNDVPNIIVVSKNESLLISSKKKATDIKKILQKKEFKEISEFQNIFYKPWGHYETYINSTNYLVKKLTVKPKHRLSLQYHKYRTEHWVVVEGIAKITKGSKKKILRKNESTFIPIGVKHCIENIGTKNLEIIEVQMGKILKESDIVRLDDPYKR